jgi:hypothetical protein
MHLPHRRVSYNNKSGLMFYEFCIIDINKIQSYEANKLKQLITCPVFSNLKIFGVS